MCHQTTKITKTKGFSLLSVLIFQINLTYLNMFGRLLFVTLFVTHKFFLGLILAYIIYVCPIIYLKMATYPFCMHFKIFKLYSLGGVTN